VSIAVAIANAPQKTLGRTPDKNASTCNCKCAKDSLFANPSARAAFKLKAVNTMNVSLTPIVSLLAGILILVVPRMLNYIVAIYLILVGLIGLFGTGAFHFR
jgi:hypothetical protein